MDKIRPYTDHLIRKDPYVVPRLGDFANICTGAVVIGDVNIGDDVTIGANSIVTKNVEENSMIAGITSAWSAIVEISYIAKLCMR